MPQNVFGVIFSLFFGILGVLIILYVGNSFLHFLPRTALVTNATYAPATNVVNYVQTFYDGSFVFIAIFGVIIVLVTSWFRPNIGAGIVELILLFILSYFALAVNNFLGPINTALPFSQYLPITYSFFNNGYYVLITFFGLILSIIFNFRQKPSKG